MAKLYFNSEALIPGSASISGKDLVIIGADAVVTPSAAFQQDFYEQPVGTKTTDGSQIPLYTTATSKTAALLDAGPAWLFAPQRATDGVLNLGTAGAVVGSYQNGAALGGSAPFDRFQTVVLDGANDYVDTGWLTRTNLAIQPSPEPELGTAWTGTGRFFNNPSTLSRNTATKQLDGNACWKIVCPGALTTEGFAMTTNINCTIGVTYIFSIYLKGETGTEEARVHIGASEVGSGTSTVTKLSKEWQRLTISWTATKTGSFHCAVTGPASVKAQTFYADMAVCEVGAVVRPAFPLVADVASGAAIFQGTAYNSESDIGPFARKSLRTYVWTANRTNTATFDTVFGGGNSADGVVMRAQEGSAAGRFYPSTVGGAKEFASGQAAGTNWMTLTYNDATKAVRLYLNGTAVEAESTTPAGFPTPVGSALWIGNSPNSGGPPWLGRIGPLAVIPRYLTATEVANINSGVGS